MNQANTSENFSVALPSWRQELYEELHARPFPFIQGDAQVSQLACRHDIGGGELARQHLSVLCQRYELPLPEEDASCLYVKTDDFELRWEMHTEFCSYTFIGSRIEAVPFAKTAIELLPAEWLRGIPGEVVSAAHVSVMAMPDELDSLDILRQHFEEQRLIGSRIGDDRAHIWTSFLAKQDGFSRFLIHNKSLNKCEMGRLVQRLLEIETYRLFSLLSLPLAKESLPQINRMDEALCEAVKDVSSINGHAEEKALLQKLTDFSTEIESLRARINFRSNATQAYARLVKKRIDELAEVRHPGLQSLDDFLGRRFAPAVRTIAGMSKRLDDLSTRIDRATDLIRTRVDLEIEHQNQKLLSSLNERGRRQYRLQKTVEGLSVVAISYYLVELIKLTVPGSRWLGLDVNPDDVAVFTVPLILTVMILVSRSIRNRMD
ncbi:MAG: DUF3422 domain-containing protein [Candidatus Pelagadaptatus aseana]|uniref:DUF3422 family protein n=1 Tax=Candidatus Pelagadaptatus aseana TaxID=3120508 RepID=UPI0039B32003